ncbi:hypothetical protein NQZ68_008890 [Dissostichus eleginoides]|nr:hypothetical protein NQZ68_008890 [Dissostichus eleginoides]
MLDMAFITAKREGKHAAVVAQQLSEGALLGNTFQKTERREQLLTVKTFPDSTQFGKSHSERAASCGSSFLIFKYYFGCLLRAVERLPWSVCSMEAKSLFSLHRALAQPVKMCMFDFPVSILDDLVSDANMPPHESWLCMLAVFVM